MPTHPVGLFLIKTKYYSPANVMGLAFMHVSCMCALGPYLRGLRRSRYELTESSLTKTYLTSWVIAGSGSETFVFELLATMETSDSSDSESPSSGSASPPSPSSQRSYVRSNPRRAHIVEPDFAHSSSQLSPQFRSTAEDQIYTGPYPPQGTRAHQQPQQFASRSNSPYPSYPYSRPYTSYPSYPSYPVYPSYPSYGPHPSYGSYPSYGPYPSYPFNLPYQSYRSYPPPTPNSYHTSNIPLANSYKLQHHPLGAPTPSLPEERVQTPPSPSSTIAQTCNSFDATTFIQSKNNAADPFDVRETKVNNIIKIGHPLSGSAKGEDTNHLPPKKVYTQPTFNHGEKAIPTEIYEIIQTRLTTKLDDRNHDIATLIFGDKGGLVQAETRWM